ncbi:MAG TPA: DNA-formamidopyrimidine glycosylase family protein, partial [Candidatus Binatus sp.]|nr:DNA-formamidopyrimidine glycosylase family protein [Candidatus Binatus sp.]
MPELPDITIYIEALQARLLGQPVEKIRLGNPFLLRSFEPPIRTAEGKKIVALQRLGKRIVFELEGELFLVFHLMITGRFHWKKRAIAIPKKYGHAAFDFPAATLLLTEMGTKKRVSLHLIQGRENLIEHDPGGVEIFAADLALFRAALTRENHTLKRTLTDPHVFSGIGNAYSDEILHWARLSPVKRTKQLSDAEIETLFGATKACLSEWIERLRRDTGKEFPERVTAFRDEMAVHGKYRKPCPVC